MKKLFIIMNFIVFFNFSYANSMILSSGPFYFPDGIIPPKKQSGCKGGEKDCDFKTGVFKFALSGLEFNRIYDITCEIENPTYNKPYPVVIKMLSGSINGVTSPSGQYLLDHHISKYAARVTYTMDNYGKTTTLLFYNFDDSDAVYIKNCKAIYAVS